MHLSLRVVRLATGALVALAFSIPPAHAVPLLFWTTGSTVQRAQLDGGGLTDVVTGQNFAVGIAVDEVADKVYWNDQGNPGSIQRANPDGTGVETVTTSVRGARGMALDVGGDKVYWAEVSGPVEGINRANLDGTDVENLARRGEPSGVALDTGAGKIYWGNRNPGGIGSIERANLDGSGVETLLGSVAEPQEIELDVAGGKMYFVDSTIGELARANLDGSGLETLVTGLNLGAGLALDLVNSKMYWTELFGGAIRRADLDGTNIETVLSGLSSPRYLTLADVDLAARPAPEPASTLLIAVGLLGMACAARWQRRQALAV
jgi:sugar lactone lactonase YvrE